MEDPRSASERSIGPRPLLQFEDFIRIPLPGFVDFASRSCSFPNIIVNGPGSEREYLPTRD